MPSSPGHIYCKLPPENIAMFRFLLEARDNLAQFTVLERKTALLKIFFPAGNYWLAQRFLDETATELNLMRETLPYPRSSSGKGVEND